MVFASAYPRDVAGMVLLDPPPLSFLLGKEHADLGAMAARMTAEWQAIADSSAGSTEAQDRRPSAFFRMIASEHREMSSTAKRVEGIAALGDLPLIVIAAGKPNPAFGPIAEEFQSYWVEQSRALTEKSTKGKFILARASSHCLYLDVPELVEESILSVVNDVRAQPAAGGAPRRLSPGLGRSQGDGPEPMRYHHLGIPTKTSMLGEVYLEGYKAFCTDHESNPFGIQWMRYEADCPLPELVKSVAHVAFEVDDLAAALEGHEILIAPNCPSEGVRVAFVV
jgi:hypothetical protein